IRAQSQFAHTPIIVFTNAYVPNMIHESFGAGATQVFNKATLTPRQIIDALQNAIAYATGQPLPNPVASPSSDTDTPLAAKAGSGEAPFHEGAPRKAPSNIVQIAEVEGDAKFQAELL